MEKYEETYEEIKKIKFVSFGSPLIDLIGDVDDKFVENYKIRMGETRHEEVSKVPFFNEFKQLPLTYVPGGCQFNAMRIFNVRNIY